MVTPATTGEALTQVGTGATFLWIRSSGSTEWIEVRSRLRLEVLSLLRSAQHAQISLPPGEMFPEEAGRAGSNALRAWVLATACRRYGLTGPASPPSDLECALTTPRSPLNLEPTLTEIASRAVAEVASIQRASETVSGADTSLVNSLLADSLSTVVGVYANGGEIRKQLCDALTFAGANYDFPWHLLSDDAESLAILYNFSPFQDTGSTVASKRIREFGETFDVISCSFLQHKKQDPTVETISRPYIATKEFLPMSPSWASWPAFRGFAEKAASSAEARIHSGRKYQRLYTRAMWAPSLYAGVRIKDAHPNFHWIAEFSDPLSLDVEGAQRGGVVPRDAFTTPLIAQLESQYGRLSESDLTIFRFAELMVYAWADSIIFTNAHQRRVMLETITNDELRTRAEELSIVSQHPTLPSGYYELEPFDYSVDSEHVHLAYFGEFYTARGITEITDALRALPSKIRSRIHLHVFTNYIPESAGGVKPASFSRPQFDLLVARTLEGVGVHEVEESVTFNNSLPYLKFLAISQAFDYLIVTDARSGTGHPVNPYLPSKWSDYSGSSAKVWALLEEGSVLSGMPVDVRTPIGDSHTARSELWNMVEAKFGSTDELVTSERQRVEIYK